MATRMAHPDHGFTHAYNTVDRAYLESLGWSVEEDGRGFHQSNPPSVLREVSGAEEVGQLAASAGKRTREMLATEYVEHEPEPDSLLMNEGDEEFLLKELYFVTFGKKPHHMAKLETIRKAINDHGK